MMNLLRRGRISAVTVLVVINSLVFIIGRTEPPDWRMWDYIMSPLSRDSLMQGHVWELISYQFLHWNVFHLLFNMAALWFAGQAMEYELGVAGFLVLYFVSGVAGGLLQVMVSPPWEQVLGASASVCGVLAGFSTMYPEMMVTALIFFVLPLKMRAKWLGIGIVVLSLVFLLLGWFRGIGHAAHLGGAIAGFLIVLLYGRRRRFFSPVPEQP